MSAVVPTREAWNRVSEAVKKVEAGQTGFQQSPRDPYYVFPAVVFKVTGPKSGGYYPGVLLAWDNDAEAWVETEECYIKG